MTRIYITNPQSVNDDYVIAGLSTGQIADKYGYKKNTVLRHLWKQGLLRQGVGRAIEREVAIWLYPLAGAVFLMKGDCPFDLLVDGQRVNVKSAVGSYTRNGRFRRHLFTLSHAQSNADYHAHVDQFYLVFRDMPYRPVYMLEAASLRVKSCLAICDPDESKYPLRLIGYLDKRGGGTQ